MGASVWSGSTRAALSWTEPGIERCTPDDPGGDRIGESEGAAEDDVQGTDLRQRGLEARGRKVLAVHADECQISVDILGDHRARIARAVGEGDLYVLVAPDNARIFPRFRGFRA